MSAYESETVKDIIREWPYWSNYSLNMPEPVKLKIDGRKDNSLQ